MNSGIITLKWGKGGSKSWEKRKHVRLSTLKHCQNVQSRVSPTHLQDCENIYFRGKRRIWGREGNRLILKFMVFPFGGSEWTSLSQVKLSYLIVQAINKNLWSPSRFPHNAQYSMLKTNKQNQANRKNKQYILCLRGLASYLYVMISLLIRCKAMSINYMCEKKMVTYDCYPEPAWLCLWILSATVRWVRVHGGGGTNLNVGKLEKKSH